MWKIKYEETCYFGFFLWSKLIIYLKITVHLPSTIHWYHHLEFMSCHFVQFHNHNWRYPLRKIFFFKITTGGRRICHFLKPSKLTQELSQKMSYSSELWYGTCFYDVYYDPALVLMVSKSDTSAPPPFLFGFIRY